MNIVATTSLPAVDRPNADRWNAACSRQYIFRVNPTSEYEEAHGTTLVMYSEIIFSVSGLNTLSVRVRVVSLSGLRPVRVMSLSGLCPCPGYVPVRVVSVRVVSVRVVSCPGCVCPGCVVAPLKGSTTDGC